MPKDCNLLVILGPTASGKTKFAVGMARELNAEIISADSRQVYRGMDIGTGKDLSEYTLSDGQTIPYHLIDICPAGSRYNLFEYQRDFARAWQDISSRNKLPILCGGSGLYIEAVLKGYTLPAVPENPALRASLQGKSLAELSSILAGYKNLHNTSDTDTPKRALRAIEIAEYLAVHPEIESDLPALQPYIIGLEVERQERRRRISQRLQSRLDQGMIEEVRALLESGIEPESLIYYGLEYKFLTLHVLGKLSYDEMYRQLETAIHQFAKRQMTWFRGMERRGLRIHWIKPETA
ncbi:MAG: tRNA (adenosine(37)-N6)-dimethylallyltransferase MiaA [Bacteroidales bacterium]|nr:tRNA (adenosine(37)-N6)-dimethylallyltransferase MiaA [Bacteroidales bacterium]MDD4362550.1 tRNA (adenosine(37)-N6)-dimethylallyltransferase MiaA [Bacteroidales bacterium]